MKKFLISALFLLGMIGFTEAQTAAPVGKVATKTTVKKPATTVSAKTAVTTKTASTTTTATVAPAKGMKKDGTPDMRFKENKMAKEGPKKKDGTPDMRYKANKKK